MLAIALALACVLRPTVARFAQSEIPTSAPALADPALAAVAGQPRRPRCPPRALPTNREPRDNLQRRRLGRDPDQKPVQHRPRRRLGDVAAVGLLVRDARVRVRANDQLAARPGRAGAVRHAVFAATQGRPTRPRRRDESLPGERQPGGASVCRGGEKMGPARRSKSNRRSSTPANASSTNCGVICASSTASPPSDRCSACWAPSAA